MWGKSSLFVLLLAVLALGANVRANDGNPCRHIEIYDPYLGGNAVFDLSSLIDVYVHWRLDERIGVVEVKVKSEEGLGEERERGQNEGEKSFLSG